MLLSLVLEDALKMGITRDEKLIQGFIKALSRQLCLCDYGHWYSLEGYTGSASIGFQNVGHILGPAYVEIRHQQQLCTTQHYKAVFSGD